jgi:Methyltransferase domain
LLERGCSAVVQNNDPDQLGYSLASVKETLLSLLDAVGASSVLEIGAYRGQLTEELLGWATSAGARVAAVDPDPPPELLELAEGYPDLELIRETSHEALRRIPLPDAVIIDGDHNYYTVSGELRLIHEKRSGSASPLLMFHDVGWPLARRDTYHVPDRIPEECRQPLAASSGLSPEPSFSDDRPFAWTAAREGGPRNGVLTAIEDFIEAHEGFRLAVVPAFFGFGILWHRDAPWANAVAGIVAPLDGHPLLERLEANRVAHLLAKQGQARELQNLRDRNEQLRERIGRQEALLRRMLGSNAFALAERLSALRQRGRPLFSRDEVERALRD